MKLSRVVIIFSAVIGVPLLTSAAPAREAISSSKVSILERGAHHKIVRHVAWQTNAAGRVAIRTNTYTELATGLHYLENGEWKEAKEKIHLLPNGGAAATNGQHSVYFPADIYDGVIETVTSDGKRLKSRPLGVSYFDGSNSVLIAELTNSVGQLLPSGNQVIYTNCFTDFAADLVCTYRKSGFESDLVFRGQPPGPEEFGLDPNNSRLQLLTEFFDTPEPEKVGQSASKRETDAGLSDQTLKFGDMRMIRGHAFAIGDAVTTNSVGRGKNTNRNSGRTPVYKSWGKIEGRTFLIEELPVKISAPRSKSSLPPVRLRPRPTGLLDSPAPNANCQPSGWHWLR